MEPKIPFPTDFPSSELMYIYRYLTGREGDKRTMYNCAWYAQGFVMGEVFKADANPPFPPPMGDPCCDEAELAARLEPFVMHECQPVHGLESLDLAKLVELAMVLKQIFDMIWKK